MDWLTASQWSPYVVGTGIGLLVCLSFLLSDKPIGCSAAFAKTSGMIERLWRGAKVLEKPYFQKFVPAIDWEWMMVLGILLGAFLSAQLSGQFHLQWVPDRWAQTFGHSAGLRWAVALLGGMVMGFGARWAGGCTSGHGISGTLQLSLGSWLAVICFFAGGIGTAMLLFKVVGG